MKFAVEVVVAVGTVAGPPVGHYCVQINYYP